MTTSASSHSSSSDCRICPAGTFSEVVGSVSVTDCQNCAMGRYNANTGGDSSVDDSSNETGFDDEADDAARDAFGGRD